MKKANTIRTIWRLFNIGAGIFIFMSVCTDIQINLSIVLKYIVPCVFLFFSHCAMLEFIFILNDRLKEK